MKNKLIKLMVVASGVAIAAMAGATEGDLKFLGYSQEMINDVVKATGGTTAKNQQKSDENLSEVDAVQEQLFALGQTRSLNSTLENRSKDIREDVISYWDRMSPVANKSVPLSDELKETISANLRAALEKNGFTIVQLDLLDLPEGSLHNKLRAVVRVSRAVSANDAYTDIQKNLIEVRNICSEAATVNDFCYLSEMTTFVAENPKNSYYYEKTILKP